MYKLYLIDSKIYSIVITSILGIIVLGIFSTSLNSFYWLDDFWKYNEMDEKGIDIFMTDYSIEKPSLDHPNFHFTKKFLGADDLGTYMTLDSWISQKLPQYDKSDLLL